MTRYRLMILLLSSTAILGACAAGPSGGVGETVIQGPDAPITRTVEVPVIVQVPEANPPKDAAPVKRTVEQSLKDLAGINANRIIIPDPDDYIGVVYEVPTVPDMIHQIYMAEGKPTTIDAPPGETILQATLSKPDKWEKLDLGQGRNEQGQVIHTIQIRPYESGFKGEILNIKTDKVKMYRFKINTYKGIFHHGVRMKAPAKGLIFEPPEGPIGVEPIGHEPRIPTEAGDYAYSVSRANVPWRPSSVFSHAGKTFIELPRDAGPVTPPNIVDTSTGTGRPVNWYRSHKRYMIIPDQVLTKAELRRDGTVIKIERIKE